MATKYYIVDSYRHVPESDMEHVDSIGFTSFQDSIARSILFVKEKGGNRAFISNYIGTCKRERYIEICAWKGSAICNTKFQPAKNMFALILKNIGDGNSYNFHTSAIAFNKDSGQPVQNIVVSNPLTPLTNANGYLFESSGLTSFVEAYPAVFGSTATVNPLTNYTGGGTAQNILKADKKKRVKEEQEKLQKLKDSIVKPLKRLMELD